MALLDIQDLTVGFGASRPALDRIGLALGEGEAALVCGAGASGKSVLLAAAAGVIPRLVKPRLWQGEVRLHGAPLSGLGAADLFRAVSPVFQNLDDQLWNLSVEDLIAFPLENRRMERAALRRRVAELMDLFALWPLSGRMVLDLSGGERRMVALAAALAGRPRLLALDEPTTGLDPAARARLLGILTALRAAPEAPALLAADQDAAALAPAMDRIAFLTEGRLGAALPRAEAMARPGSWDEAGILPPSRRRPCRAQGAPGESLLDVFDLRSVLRRGTGAPVLDAVSFGLRRGEVLGLVGRNGAGKTTLFQTVLGLARAAAGRILIAGEEARDWTPARRARRIGYMPQNMRRVLFNLSVIDEAAFAVCAETRRLKEPAVAARARAALDTYGLAGKTEANPFALSAREQALLGLACLEAAESPVAILDEPLLARDALGRAMLERFLAAGRAQGRAAILISHDLELVDDVADRVMILEEGRIGFDGPTGEAWAAPAFARLGWPRPYADLERAA
ncbi:ABC transporter ATP-binding protein [Methylobacterium organophilum]|uniref:ABC transporter ATP-binding protein n=1 Tax=Methylobacterium organophilum TaxID=410 RepID=UPI001EE19B81|nr:ATP-binding cassette domain-containing protein [Methylobacterium organophilum]